MKNIIVNNKTYNLSLDYILGFYEGDGSITIQFKPNKTHKTGKQIVLIFEIHQHVIDVDLLTAISKFLECGKVEIGRKIGNPDTWVYRLRISSQDQIFSKLLPVLESNDMMLNKRNHDINIFKQACFIVKNKKHTTLQGLQELESIASQLSSRLNLEDKLKLPFINKNLNSDRILGFTDAEGHFSFSIVKYKNTEVRFKFSITQEKSEIQFLNQLKVFFNCGYVYENKKGGAEFVVQSKQDLYYNAQKGLVPFFIDNKLQTIKKFSFNKFEKALKICITNKILLNNHFEELNNILSDMEGQRPIK
jgi:hypothetical protein